MQNDATVTAADIARLAGVGRAAVSNWRRRHDDFPQPVGGTTASPAFSLQQVEKWLAVQGKLTRAPVEERIWQELRGHGDERRLADVMVAAGTFLLMLHRDPERWACLAREDDDRLAGLLPGAVRAAGGRFFPAALNVDRVPLVRALAEFAADRGPADTFEFLRTRFSELRSRRLSGTPRPVVDLVYELAGPGVRTVFDPACGSGGLLLGALDHVPGPRLRGQELDEPTARLTALRLALRTAGADVRSGDSLRASAFPGLRADLVVSTPPFNDRGWGYEELSADPRWEYGLPPRMESELAWVQHALAHAKPGGLVVMVMPPAAAGRRSGRRIRGQLLRRGALRAVVGLPLGAIPNMAVALTLWILRRPDPADRPPDRILMADTAGREDFAAVAVAQWRRFERDPEAEHEEPGVSRAVRIIDLLDDEIDLTPSRYLSQAVEIPSALDLAGTRDELLNLLKKVSELVPEVLAGQGSGPLIPIAELARTGALTVMQAQQVQACDEAGQGPPVLTVEDVVRGTPPSARLTDRDVGELMTEPGDVLVPSLVRAPVAQVDERGGVAVGRQLFVLRPDPERIDPQFLAGILRSSLNLRHYTPMSTSYRVDVRRAEVPLPPIERQRACGEAFRRLEAFRSAMREAAELGEHFTHSLADALADGTLSPRDR